MVRQAGEIVKNASCIIPPTISRSNYRNIVIVIIQEGNVHSKRSSLGMSFLKLDMPTLANIDVTHPDLTREIPTHVMAFSTTD